MTIGYPYPPGGTNASTQQPNRLFPIDRYVPIDHLLEMPIHRFYWNQLQINGGKLDQYVAWSDSGSLPMGYFDTAKLPLLSWAREYTLLDNFFVSAYGGSFLNHIWLICACTATFPSAPAKLIADPVLDANGLVVGLTRDGSVTPDGYATDQLQPWNQPTSPALPTRSACPPRRRPPSATG